MQGSAISFPYAVHANGLVCFSFEVDSSYKGDIREEVVLEPLPAGWNKWKEGDARPAQVVCTAIEDPKRYRVFKYDADVDAVNYERVGGYGGARDSYPGGNAVALKF